MYTTTPYGVVIFTNGQVSLKFAGNRAIIGSAVYANTLDLCSWYSFELPHFYTNRSDILRWPFVSYGYGNNIFKFKISQFFV